MKPQKKLVAEKNQDFTASRVRSLISIREFQKETLDFIIIIILAEVIIDKK